MPAPGRTAVARAPPCTRSSRAGLRGRAPQVVSVARGEGGGGGGSGTAGEAGALARQGRGVGVLDAELDGPSARQVLQVPLAGCRLQDGFIEPAVSAEGIRCFSMALLL